MKIAASCLLLTVIKTVLDNRQYITVRRGNPLWLPHFLLLNKTLGT